MSEDLLHKVIDKLQMIEANMATKDDIARLDERFSQIDDRFSQIDERFSRIDDELARMHRKLDSAIEQIAKNTEMLSNMPELIQTVRANTIDIQLLKKAVSSTAS